MATPVGAAGSPTDIGGRSDAVSDAVAALADVSVEPSLSPAARRSEPVALNSGMLRRAVGIASSSAGSASDNTAAQEVVVEVIVKPEAAGVQSLVAALGGTVLGTRGI